jgi:hypothetical protein
MVRSAVNCRMSTSRSDWEAHLAKMELKRVTQIGRVTQAQKTQMAGEWNGNVAIVNPLRKRIGVAPKKRVGLASVTTKPIYQLVGMCRGAGLPEPTPEYTFHPTRGWKFDYAFPAERLAVEIEGGIWKKGGGAHSHPLNIERDIEKYNEAAILGWRILRVVPERWTEAIVLIQRALDDGAVAA